MFEAAFDSLVEIAPIVGRVIFGALLSIFGVGLGANGLGTVSTGEAILGYWFIGLC